MCARFTLRISPATLATMFELDEIPEIPIRYNIAPTQDIAAVTESREGDRRLRFLRWGLVPSWAKSPAVGQMMINSKAETLSQKSAFKRAFERRRCLIPADGFYEWAEVPAGPPENSLFEGVEPGPPKTRKQPYLISLKGGEPFAFAGIWERWGDPKGQTVDSCSIVTTDSNELIAPVHDRMPVILGPDAYDLWLDRSEMNTKKLTPMLVPYPAREMEMMPVNPIVGNPRIDGPECVEPFHAA